MFYLARSAVAPPGHDLGRSAEPVNNPRVRSIAAIAGALLLTVGGVLALVISGAWDSSSPAKPVSATPFVAETAGTVSPGDAPTVTSPGTGLPTAAAQDPDSQSSATQTAEDEEPSWRFKQREVEREMLRSDQPNESVGAVALISLDPSRKEPSEVAAAPAVAPVSPVADDSSAPTRVVLEGGATPLVGVWAGAADELARYLLTNKPSPQFTVPVLTLAGYYVRLAAEVGLRADILWAQMLHETGFGTYGGDVKPSQNNFAGIGATGGGAAGFSFPTAEAGVKAHIAHMVAYVFTTDQAEWTNSSVDPRYGDVSPRGIARTLSDLNGRWAVPGDGYGAAIERHVRAINSP